MENKEEKGFYYKLLIATAIIIPVIIGFSYAYFTAKIKGNTTTITGTAISSFNFNLITENNGYINASNIIPITSASVDEMAPTGTFQVQTGVNNYNVSYTISLTDITITNGLKSADFKWKLTCTSCNDTDNDATGSFQNYTSGDLELKNGLIIASSSTDTYELRLWVEETYEDQTESILNQSFSAKINAVGEFVMS